MCVQPLRIPAMSATQRDVVPDALFGLEYRGADRARYRFSAVEVDRGTMPVVRRDGRQTSYQAKLAAYVDAIMARSHKEHLGLPNLLVLTVTEAPGHPKTMLQGAAGFPDAAPAFLFKAAVPPKAPEHSLLLEPWTRAGHDPLAITESAP